MRTLTTTDFFVLMMNIAENKNSNLFHENLSNGYENFKKSLVQLREKEPCLPELMRTLDYARIELIAIEAILEAKEIKNSLAISYCIKAINLIDCELRILMLSLSHPHFSYKEELCDVSSPLFWSDKYTKTDLVEILTALCSAGAIILRNGSPANMTVVVQVFEKVLNTKIKNADTMRWYALNRKIKLTNFIDTLKTAMLNLSRE